MIFENFEFGIINLVCFIGAHTLEHADQIDHTAIRCTPRRHWSSADENGRDIESHRSHQHTGNDLVTVWNTNHSIETMRRDHRLHTVGD